MPAGLLAAFADELAALWRGGVSRPAGTCTVTDARALVPKAGDG
jgi:hypothetical protein